MLVEVLVVATLLLTVYVKWSFGHWRRKGIPHVVPIFPFGNAKDLVLQRATFGETFAAIYNRFREDGHRCVGGYFFTVPLLVVMDPELIRRITVKDFDHFADRGIYVNERDDPLSAHLFTLSGDAWRRLRVKLTPTFTSAKMKTMFRTLVDCAAGLTDIVSASVDADGVDIKDVVGRYTTDVIGSCAFGLDCNSLNDPDAEFRVYGKKFFDPSPFEALKMFLQFLAPGVLEALKARVTNDAVETFFVGAVRRTVEHRELNGVVRPDFMHLLLQLKNDDDATIDDRLTVEQIAAQSFLFFIAGFETSSTTLTFCLYELVRNAHIQEKLRHEIVTVLNGYDGNVTYEAIRDMKYMDNVISETLRKYPPAPVINRICTRDYDRPDLGVRISEGTRVFIPLLALQNDPKHFPQPERFDPDRFGDEAKQTRHPYAYLPFGEGPRVCIGLRFGMMQTKVALTVLLKNFRFTLNRKTNEPLVMEPKSFVTTVKGGVWLNADKIC